MQYAESVRCALIHALADSPVASRSTTPDIVDTYEDLDLLTDTTRNGAGSAILLPDPKMITERTNDSHPIEMSQSLPNNETSLPTSQPVLVPPVASQSDMSPAGPRNYAPPDKEGVKYRPSNLPEPLDVKRGGEGRYPWYVVKKSRSPGIYASW